MRLPPPVSGVDFCTWSRPSPLMPVDVVLLLAVYIKAMPAELLHRLRDSPVSCRVCETERRRLSGLFARRRATHTSPACASQALWTLTLRRASSCVARAARKCCASRGHLSAGVVAIPKCNSNHKGGYMTSRRFQLPVSNGAPESLCVEILWMSISLSDELPCAGGHPLANVCALR